MINNIDIPQTRGKKEQTQITNIMNETEDITTDYTDIKSILF